jgi:riboflavin synthase
MFTGLIEEIGTVMDLPNESAQRLEIAAPRLAGKVRLRDRVAVNSCCLTDTAGEHERIGFDLLQESLDRTNLKTARADFRLAVALRPSLRATSFPKDRSQ